MRSYWHPYTDDSPPARIDVTHVDCWLALVGEVPQLSKHFDTVGVGMMFNALRRRHPFHSPTFGCIFHTD